MPWIQFQIHIFIWIVTFFFFFLPYIATKWGLLQCRFGFFGSRHGCLGTNDCKTKIAINFELKKGGCIALKSKRKFLLQVFRGLCLFSLVAKGAAAAAACFEWDWCWPKKKKTIFLSGPLSIIFSFSSWSIARALTQWFDFD